eukprot:scaffold1075_cov246-Chaetoceros_neogracile.AAC.8
MMQDDNEAVTSPLYTGFPSDQDDANGGSVADGTFAYDDDYSEITVPHTPSVVTRIRYGQDEDSAHDKISVSSSFMNYSYSNNYEDNSTIATATVAKARQNGEFVDTASSVGFNSTMADIDIGAESQGRGRPAPLNVTDIMQSGDDELEDSRRERLNCIPAWVANASNSIKFVIVLATAMFLASVALVSISLMNTLHEKEWNNCPDFDESRSMWKNAFVNFEENWNMETRGYTVERQNDREENFAFAYKDAVYVGLNMVTGIIRDQTEWDSRLDDNMRWVEENVEKNLDAKLIVMFGSAGVIDKNDRFFTSLEAKANEWARDGRTNLHFLYVKQSSTDLAHFDNVRGMSNLSVLNIESDQWPPTKLSIDTERYKMTFDDTMWFEEGSDS